MNGWMDGGVEKWSGVEDWFHVYKTRLFIAVVPAQG
jgi:hypothetical protein